MNRKRVLRVYRDAGLHVRRRRRKRLSVARTPASVPRRPNERWSMDFMSNTLGDGRTFRLFTGRRLLPRIAGAPRRLSRWVPNG